MKTMNLHCLHRFHFFASSPSSPSSSQIPSRRHHPFGVPYVYIYIHTHENLQKIVGLEGLLQVDWGGGSLTSYFLSSCWILSVLTSFGTQAQNLSSSMPTGSQPKALGTQEDCTLCRATQPGWHTDTREHDSPDVYINSLSRKFQSPSECLCYWCRTCWPQFGPCLGGGGANL